MTPTSVNGIRCTGCGSAFNRFARFEAHACNETEGDES